MCIQALPLVRLVLGGVLAVLLAGGCTPGMLIAQKEPPALYLLKVPAELDEAESRPAEGPTLLVSAVRSAAGFGGSDMIYVVEEHRLQSFARHRWVDSPARMLEPLLVAAAERSGLFAQVAAPGSQALGTLRLDTEVLVLQQRFVEQDSRLELALRVSLIDARSHESRASEVIRIELQAEPTPYGGVVAANRAVELLGERLLAFLRRALAAP